MFKRGNERFHRDNFSVGKFVTLSTSENTVCGNNNESKLHKPEQNKFNFFLKFDFHAC